MEENSKLFYKESGIANPINITLSICCSLVLIFFLAYFYSLFSTFFPVVYFNVVAVVVFGFALSFISRFFNRLFKIRSRKKSIIITVILALFGWYFQWVWYIFIVSTENFTLFGDLTNVLFALFRPDLVISDIIEINKIGVWGIGSIPFTGVVLWIIWFVEAAIIFFISYNNYAHFETVPFSEKDNTWFKKQHVDYDFEYIVLKQKFIDELIKNPSETIKNLEKGDGLRHSRLSIYSSLTEPRSLITINNVRIAQRGKGKKETTEVLKSFYINNIHLKEIRDNFRIEKASVFEF